MTDTFVPFDLTENYAILRRQEEQMLEIKLQQIRFDCAMQEFQAAMMIANFNLTCFVYASLNPNLSQQALTDIFGKRL